MLNASPILTVAASPALLAKGAVNVIEFENLKQSAGDRWPRICEGVYARLEGLLRAKLGPNDLFLRLGETAYLVTMPLSEAEDVSAICTRVAFDLQLSFLGQCELQDIVVDTASNDDDDTLVLKRIPLDKIVPLAVRGGISLDTLKTAGKKFIESHKAREPAGESYPIQAHHKTPRFFPIGLGDEETQCEIHFVPVWSVPNAAVTCYTCEPRSVRMAGRPGSVAPSQLSSEERIGVEIAALRAGTEQLTKFMDTERRFLLSVGLSFDVIGIPAGRMEVLATCRSLSEHLRSFISFLIYDVPPGVAQSRLAGMVMALRPFGRGIFATVAPGTRSFGAYESIGLRGVGFNLKEFSQAAPVRQLEIEQLAQFGRRAGLMTFLRNVPDKATLRFVQDAGIQNVSGPAVLPPTVEPEGMLRLSWAQVLAQPVTEIWL